MPSKTHLVIDDIEILLRVNKRAKRISLRIDSCQPIMTLPSASRLNMISAEKFARTKVDWIRSNAKVSNDQPLGDWQTLWVDTGPAAKFDDVNQLATFNRGKTDQAILSSIKKYALSAVQPVLVEAARGNGFASLLISFKVNNFKARWGSCSTTGEIKLAAKLAFLSSEQLGYVIAHELAHLKHHNHSRSFWAEVAQIEPDYKTIKNSLRAQSPKIVVQRSL